MATTRLNVFDDTGWLPSTDNYTVNIESADVVSTHVTCSGFKVH